MEAKSLVDRLLFISPLHLKTLLPRRGNDTWYNPQILFSHYFRNVNKLCMEESLIMPKHFFIHILNTLGEALTVQDNTHTHTQRHISAVILAKFSNVWFGYVAAPSFWFLLSFLSYFGKKKKDPNLLLLSLDNGRLCICCICIHKIKTKAEIFPVWDCYLVSVHVLWLLLSV